MDSARQLKKKICLLGSFGVGKTSLVERFVYNRFGEEYLSTLGVRVSQKRLPSIESSRGKGVVQYTFLIWDIAGMDKFDAVVENYFRGAAGALAVMDLTRPETAERLERICHRFLSVTENAKLLVLGNKLDLVHDEDDREAHPVHLAKTFATDYLLTSARTGENVEKAFLTLAQKLQEG